VVTCSKFSFLGFSQKKCRNVSLMVWYVVMIMCVCAEMHLFCCRLKPYTSYKFRMMATNDVGESAFSKETEPVTTLQDGNTRFCVFCKVNYNFLECFLDLSICEKI